jgi:hypothetical protein
MAKDCSTCKYGPEGEDKDEERCFLCRDIDLVRGLWWQREGYNEQGEVLCPESETARRVDTVPGSTGTLTGARGVTSMTAGEGDGGSQEIEDEGRRSSSPT